MRGHRSGQDRGFNRIYWGKNKLTATHSADGPRGKIMCPVARTETVNRIPVPQCRTSNTVANAEGFSPEERLTISRRKTMRGLFVAAMPAITGCNSVLGSSKKDELLEKYQDGFSTYKTGAEKHNEAVIAYRSDDFDTVQSLLDEALTELEKAKPAFEQSRQLAKEIDNADAIEIITAAVEQTNLIIQASNQLQNTANGFANGNYESAQESYEDYKDTAAELSNRDLAEPKTLNQKLDEGMIDF
jgi:hypothetical protein